MEKILAHPDLQNLRRWLLATRDAHMLYSQFSFAALKNPAVFMERSSLQGLFIARAIRSLQLRELTLCEVVLWVKLQRVLESR